MKTVINVMATLMIIGLSGQVQAASEDSLSIIQKQWAVCQYQSKDSEQQSTCLESLITQNQSLLNSEPHRADLKVWLAINKSSLAGADGGLGALSLVKDAKQLLEQVIKQAPETLNGSAYASLGSLYYQVPGWPLSFGDDHKAETMLLKALEINPNGIDPNYFYAGFLVQDGRTEEAMPYLIQAQNAQLRADRPLADQGRQQEVAKLIGELN
jgi:tetratricopeptide (TPR) repeat protein